MITCARERLTVVVENGITANFGIGTRAVSEKAEVAACRSAKQIAKQITRIGRHAGKSRREPQECVEGGEHGCGVSEMAQTVMCSNE